MRTRLLALAMLIPLPAFAQDAEPVAEEQAEEAEATDGSSANDVVTLLLEVETTERYQPRTIRHGEYTLQLNASFRESGMYVSDVPVDSDGNEWTADPHLDGEIRLGARFSTGLAWKPVRVSAAWEHELVGGTHLGGLSDETRALLVDPPGYRAPGSRLRNASLTLDITQYVHISAGVMTSHWGLGLLANDGAHDWQPGSATFSDPRSGDTVERVMLAVGPFTSRNLLFVIAADQVAHDEAFREGDEARQLIFSALMGYGQDTQAGAYVVLREQEAADGAETNVLVADVYGRHTFELSEKYSLGIAGEFAAISGTTELGPTADYPEHDVLQLGGIGRLSFGTRNAGVVLDVGWATGDANADDSSQNAFRFDRNAEMGLLLYRYVQAAMTSRAPITAANPELVGEPSEDLDRLPTRGGITDTVAIFPRGWVRFCNSLEVYGGPMIAFSAARWADPYQTRLGGGAPTNALGGESGRYLGTEIDVGARWRGYLDGSELNLGVEGGVLLPGSALAAGPSAEMPVVWGGRLLFNYAL